MRRCNQGSPGLGNWRRGLLANVATTSKIGGLRKRGAAAGYARRFQSLSSKPIACTSMAPLRTPGQTRRAARSSRPWQNSRVSYSRSSLRLQSFMHLQIISLCKKKVIVRDCVANDVLQFHSRLTQANAHFNREHTEKAILVFEGMEAQLPCQKSFGKHR